MNPSKPLRVAVIGIGHLGKEHARIYHSLPEAQLVALCDKDPSRAHIAEGYNVPFISDYRELYEKVDAVSVVTPTSVHYPVAKDFLAKGIHTLIEKPITLRLEEADELIDLARKNRSALQVGHIERHNPGLKRIEQIVNNIRFFEIHRLGPWATRITDCGVVLDLMIHDLDIVLNLVKSEIASFDAIGINVITPFEDIANVRIKFKNGAVADLTVSRLTPEKQRKIRIFQEDAYISLDYEAQSCKIFRKEDGKITQESVDIQKAEPLKEELRFFLAGIQSGKSPGHPDEAARDALKLALEIIDRIKKANEIMRASSSKAVPISS
ncbi:MAG: Gfo/Idh/MocA family oxidoreductase [Candidatus Omnitrophica bacterium]|nr:Gfo/Idh/MocA family oxidoreductase [Candidatus Omnitrophota bacterium]